MHPRLPRPCLSRTCALGPYRRFSSLRRPIISPTSYPAPNRLRSPALAQSCRRHLHVPTVLLPPAYFVGLLLALWTWKCFVMVCFQNKIIYVPYLPPNARREEISNYQPPGSGVRWEEFRTRAADGTDLALVVASLSSSEGEIDVQQQEQQEQQPVTAHVYILYLQGNASSIPPRLPDLSFVLRRTAARFSKSKAKLRFTQVCLSYRGYWKSRGRPSEKGINQDTAAALKWIWQLHKNTYGGDGQDGQSTKPVFILWGQSVGAGFATNLAASGLVPRDFPLRAVILETPFLSIRAMLGELYPNKWIPYRYLYPFLTNHLDSWSNLGVFASRLEQDHVPKPTVFILQAGKDEIVPAEHAQKLEQKCSEVGLPVETKIVSHAYHNDAIIRGRQLVVDFLAREITSILERSTDN